MKKILMLMMLVLITQVSIAQEEENLNKNEHGFVGFSVDPYQMIDGEPQGFKWVVEAGAENDFSRVNIFYERFDEIEYVSYGLQPSFIFPVIDLVDLSLGSEISIIRRPELKSGLLGPRKEFENYVSYAFNSAISIKLMERLSIFVKADMKRRPDENRLWDFSGYSGIRVMLL
jgi:hypothetical protein